MSGSAGSAHVLVRFADIELDVAGMAVRRGGDRVAVEPQVFDVLRYLFEHRDRVVPKEELLDEVWGNRFVSESALTSRIRSARQAVGDDGQRQAVIRTVHGRGYQFVAALLGGDPSGGAGEQSTQHVAGEPVSGATAAALAEIIAPSKQLVDRVDLSRHIAHLVVPGRVVTLVGPAGVGKTLLA